jgi:hypothetical protein
MPLGGALAQPTQIRLNVGEPAEEEQRLRSLSQQPEVGAEAQTVRGSRVLAYPFEYVLDDVETLLEASDVPQRLGGERIGQDDGARVVERSGYERGLPYVLEVGLAALHRAEDTAVASVE